MPDPAPDTDPPAADRPAGDPPAGDPSAGDPSAGDPSAADHPEGAGSDGRPRSLADRALDLLVYAPAGAVLSALDDVPGMAARGRTLVEQEVRNAHLLGQLAVHEGQRRLRRRLDRPDRDRSASPPTASPPTPFPPAPSPPAASPPAPPRDATPPPAPPRGTGPTGPTGPAPRGPAGTGIPGPAIDGGAGADLAIPGYDTLPASQVVRRLDGLGPTELAAVFRHESAGRGRRTILHRAQQLLGRTDRPRSAGS